MRFLIAVILMIILSVVGAYYMPWWMIAVACFIVSLFSGFRPGWAFLAGFTAIVVFWASVALMHDLANTHILSTRMAVLFHLPNYALFICVTALVGGLVGGFSAWAGALLSGNRKQQA